MSRLKSRVTELVSAADGPVAVKELFELASSEFSEAEIRSMLSALCTSGELVGLRGDRVALSTGLGFFPGHVIGHRDGHGFVARDDGKPDVYLSPRQMRRVLHGDRVLARVKRIDSRGRPEGSVAELLETRTKTLVGRFRSRAGTNYFEPHDRRIGHTIPISGRRRGQAKDGQMVVVELTAHPFYDGQPGGAVMEVIGEHLAPGTEAEIAIRKYGLPHAWPREVSKEAERIQGRAMSDADEAIAPGCIDLRSLPFVTIDGADAKDFDDAVYAREEEGRMRLWVAIADVAFFVKPGSAIDKEAAERGNSVYFPNRVLPMLPEILSNDLCSLKPDEERRTLVCEVEVDADGGLHGARFYKAVIVSHARMTYEEVDAFLKAAGEDSIRLPEKTMQSLAALDEVYRKLREARERRGALDFEFTEAKVQYDADGRISEITPSVRLEAHRLIEECMIAANLSAASWLAEREKAAMYRVHDQPDYESVAEVRRLLGAFGVRGFDSSQSVSSAHYANALEAVRELAPGTEATLQRILLRSLKQAVYASSPGIHFALAAAQYTHFTSPIRRYPDLVVHRLLTRHLEDTSRDPDLETDFQALADHCSYTERRAEDAVRDVVNWLKAEFMLDKIGERYDGQISSVTDFGIFVQLDRFFIDGLVHISELGRDYFEFDPNRLELVGRRTRTRYRIGDPIQVRVAAVNVDEGKIDFSLVGRDRPKGRKSRRGSASKRSAKWKRIARD